MATIFDLEVDPRTWPGVHYCIWQKELCPTTKKEHLQLYCVFTKRKRRTSVLKLYKGDWRIARSPKDANKYCQKKDSRIDGPWTIGEWDKVVLQGDKFKQLFQDIEKGMKEKDIFRTYTALYVRYSTGIRRGRELMTLKRSTHTQLIWIWGPSGAGKSVLAMKMAKTGDRTVYMKNPTNKWWTGYDQEDVVIIDDFKGALYPAMLFNLGGNNHPLPIEIKGACLQFNSKEIIITSVRHPRYIYGEDTHAWTEGLRRRVKGYTIWVNPEHKQYLTDWTPCYKEDPTVPPKKERTPVTEEMDIDFDEHAQHRKILNDIGILDLTNEIEIQSL